MTVVPPGWYVDQAGTMRWWDGYRWTPYVAPPRPVLPVAPVMPVAPVAPPAPKPIEPALVEPGTLDRGIPGRVKLWQVVLVGLLALAVIVTVAWLVGAYASDPPV